MQELDLHLLRTFIAVADLGSITRASDILHLSQPAISAHIKTLEETLDLDLFTRTSRGMVLTEEGFKLKPKALQVLESHNSFLAEALRLQGQISMNLRLGIGSNACSKALGNLLSQLSEQYPDINVSLEMGSSQKILNGLLEGALDAVFYNETTQPDTDLDTVEVDQFGIFLAASPDLLEPTNPLDWKALEKLPWICPGETTCCGQTVSQIFRDHQIKPQQIVNVGWENVTRTLISGGAGIGLLHTDAAKEAEAKGEVRLLHEAQKSVQVLFATLKQRQLEPLIKATAAMIRSSTHNKKAG